MASPTIKMLWGLAKSPELSMTDEELHLLVSAHTGKDSIRALNKRELGVIGFFMKRWISDVEQGNKALQQALENTTDQQSCFGTDTII